MNKYIDAEKLYKKIDERMAKFAELENETKPDDMDLSIFYQGKRKMCSEILALIASFQQEQPMPDSTQLIELWHETKEMLKEKDFRDDPWRLAYNAYMCGFGRGVAVKKEESPEGICSCHWKPSKVQMKYLDIAIAEANGHKSYNLAYGLEKIKDDLKKL